VPINIVKVYKILLWKATFNMAKKTLGGIIKNVGQGIFNRTLGRLMGAGISTDNRMVQARAKWSGRNDKKDWRVRLQVPQGPLRDFFDFENNPIMKPLSDSDGMFWPLTPMMQIQHTSNYNALAMTHSNFPHQAYNQSQIESMNIIGEFPVQNYEDAKHWVATVHFLRTATKMFFGQDGGTGLKGNPPPILHLSGYGDHMFQKVPVVLNSFNVELRQGIDYISTKQNPSPYVTPRTRQRAGLAPIDEDESQTWAPTLSNISVLITPIYSRDSVKNFSMKKFVRGELNGSRDNEVGFI
tara:strand:+ start:5524 stop:6414 length:891 start_codon:yes stop_codon:yes gene_type:complete